MSGVFDTRNLRGPLVIPAFARVLVILRDALGRAEKEYGLRCDLPCVGGGPKVNDLFDLILQARNAAVHYFSNHRAFSGGQLAWYVNFGNTVVVINGERIKSKRPVDVMVQIGAISFYLEGDICACTNWLRRFAPDTPEIEYKINGPG